MRRATLVVAFSLWGGGALVHAEPSREAVESLLKGYERVFTEADMRALGPGTDLVLARIADDGKAHEILRVRAVSALAYAKTAAARGTLESILRRKADAPAGVDRLLLRKAAVALGWQNGPGVVARLRPLLSHDDEDVRIDAAIGLGLTRSPAAAVELRARFTDEPAVSVRHQLTKQIKAIDDDAAAEPRQTARP